MADVHEYLEQAHEAAGCLSHSIAGDGFSFGLPCGLSGELTYFGPHFPGRDMRGHSSIELHGVSLEDACRVLRVLRLGAAADRALDRAIAEAAPYAEAGE